MSCVCRLGTAQMSFSERSWGNIKLSKPLGFYTYHQVERSKILHGARFALSVLYGSENRQRPLLYAA